MQNDKSTYQLFKSDSSNHINSMLLNRFLGHVVRGEHYAVERMLKLRPDLLYRQSKVRDLSGRTFENISGFEYAMWALDKHMWTKMLDCLPKTEEGEKIKVVLRTQYQRIKETGVTYEHHGVITQTPEKHFDFEGTIIKELQENVDKDDDNQWRTGVGSAQKLLPIHVVYEYCSDTPFYPVPDFKEQPKSSKEFYNWLNNGEKESWFCEGSKLGIDFAIYKGARGGAGVAGLPGFFGRPGRVVLNAIKALYEVRTNDFLALENDLKPCNLPEHQYKN
ncbi:F-box protein [Legionella gratiana]|uniref:F-box protein n=1 Tax=Legionella gratiana TaxID=45066 RepID=UPI001041B012|nr:F-box protein [Legionella gratiana]